MHRTDRCVSCVDDCLLSIPYPRLRNCNFIIVKISIDANERIYRLQFKYVETQISAVCPESVYLCKCGNLSKTHAYVQE